MAVTPIKFLGASVRNAKSSIGWGTSGPSQLQVGLVQDPAAGDAFLPAINAISNGQPVLFEAGGMRFAGLLQSYRESVGVDGNPVFECLCVDPREILEGTQLIVSDYNGAMTIPNVLNVYGWYENIGYGNSLANETGMPWPYVANAIQVMTATYGGTAYGGPLSYRGYTYSVDLSELPSPPIYYRIAGPVVNLLQVIADVCLDGGFDFFVDLVGQTIKVRTVNRRSQPPFGVLSAIVREGSQGDVISYSYGTENRNEPTSAFLFGGEVTDLYLTTSAAMSSFWGYDFNGNPILGSGVKLPLKDKQGQTIVTVDTEGFQLNASPVADVVGDTSYDCTAFELYLAKANQESWSTYLIHHRPLLASGVGLIGSVLNPGGDVSTSTDFVDDSVATAKAIAQALYQENQYVKQMRLYEFVRAYADEYLGRQYAVSLPDVFIKQDPDTLRYNTSYDISTEGGYLPDGSSPLGLSSLNEDIFRTQDGRFNCFVRYDSLANVDFSLINPVGTAVESDSLFALAQVDPRMILLGNSALALVNLQAPLTEMAVDPLGSFDLAGAVMQASGDATNALKTNQFGTLPVMVAPSVRQPNAVAIPLKSNVDTYGPWYVIGPPGAVRVEQDRSLTPWAYGGFDTMALAGTCRVAEAVTQMTAAEYGDLGVVGLPTCGLGDTLQAGGPNVSNVELSLSEQGYTTTYRFASFTPRPGIFTKGQIERIQQKGVTRAEWRRALNASLREAQAKAGVVDMAGRARLSFMERAPKAIRKKTPHDCLMSLSYPLPGGSGTRIGISSATMEEAVAFARADNDTDYQSIAIMSMGGIFHPFSTAAGSGIGMASYGSGVASSDAKVGSRGSLDPYGGWNDTEVYSWGNTYAGLHAYRRQATGEGARVFGLKGPVPIVGWGYDVSGDPLPIMGSGDFLRHPERWKAGPLEVLWDEARGVWTSQGTFSGTAPASGISPGHSGVMTVTTAGGTSYGLYVFNDYSKAVGSGVKMKATYVANKRRLEISSADCTS